MRMPFGKHCGVPVCDLPDQYLTWLRTCDLDSDLSAAVEREYKRRFGAHHDQRRRVIQRLADLYKTLCDQPEVPL
jgi:hypothetical protein